MKKHIIMFIIFFSCLLFLAAEDGGYSVYNNDQLGFSLSYPSDWILEEHLEESEYDPYVGVGLEYEYPATNSIENIAMFAFAVMDLVKHDIDNLDDFKMKTGIDSDFNEYDSITLFGVDCRHYSMKEYSAKIDFYMLIKGNKGYLIGINIISSDDKIIKELQSALDMIFHSIEIY